MLLALLITQAGAAEKLAVLPSIVEGPYGKAETLELFDVVSKEADFRQGLAIASYNAIFVDGTEPVATTVRDCGSDVPCIALALRNAGIDLGLRVIANFALEPPLLTFNLVRSSDGSIVAESLGELGAVSLADVLVEQTKLLLDRTFHRGGRLEVQVTPQDALVTIDPPRSGGVFAPGTYRVSASKEGFLPRTEDVVVRELETATARITLETAPEASSIWESPWLWTAVGVVVVGVTVGALVATDPFSKDPTTGTVCITTVNGTCP